MSSGDSSFSPNSLIILFLLGWGFIFVGAFVKSVYLCIRRFCGYEGGRIGEEETPECYRNMSSARQEEIDNLRKSALLRNLNRYTLVRHVMCAAADFWILFMFMFGMHISIHSCSQSNVLNTDTRRRAPDLLLWITKWYYPLDFNEWRQRRERRIRQIFQWCGRERWRRGGEQWIHSHFYPAARMWDDRHKYLHNWGKERK